MKLNNIKGMLAAGAIGFGIGGLVTLVINTVQIMKVKGDAPNYKCNINAVFEPETKQQKRIEAKKQIENNK